jgi:hypothetical protein
MIDNVILSFFVPIPLPFCSVKLTYYLKFYGIWHQHHYIQLKYRYIYILHLRMNEMLPIRKNDKCQIVNMYMTKPERMYIKKTLYFSL